MQPEYSLQIRLYRQSTLLTPQNTHTLTYTVINKSQATTLRKPPRWKITCQCDRQPNSIPLFSILECYFSDVKNIKKNLGMCITPCMFSCLYIIHCKPISYKGGYEGPQKNPFIMLKNTEKQKKITHASANKKGVTFCLCSPECRPRIFMG